MRFWKKPSGMNAEDVKIFGRCKEFISLNEGDECEKGIASSIGYEVLGPMLLGFSNFLHEEVHQKGIEKIFFLSRDGWIMKKAYEILYPEDKGRTQYLKVSRHAVTIPLLADAGNYDEMIDIILDFFYAPVIERIGEICGIEKDIFDDELRDLNISGSADIGEVSADQKEQIYQLVYKYRGDFFAEQKKYLEEYLLQKGFWGKIAVVDIGWNGSIQHSLRKYTDEKETYITGFYLGVRSTRTGNYYEKDVRRGYLFEKDRNDHYREMLRYTAEITDILFVFPMKGTTIQYERDDSGIVGCCGVREYGEKEIRIVCKIQKSAIRFVQMVKESGYDFKMSPDVIMCIYKVFAVYPKNEVLRYFRQFRISDGPMLKKITPEKGLWHYLIHPDELRREINNNKCKIWFLKGLLVIPLPYYQILHLVSSMGAKSDLQKKIAQMH